MSDQNSSNPIRSALILAAVVIVVAWGSKLYETQRALEAAGPDASSVATLLAHHHDALSEKKAAPADGASASSATHTCGGGAQPPAKAGSLFADLSAELEPELARVASHYELRVVRKGDTLRWFARRDVDCDGIHEVHVLVADLDDSADADDIKTQNAGE